MFIKLGEDLYVSWDKVNGVYFFDEEAEISTNYTRYTIKNKKGIEELRKYLNDKDISFVVWNK